MNRSARQIPESPVNTADSLVTEATTGIEPVDDAARPRLAKVRKLQDFYVTSRHALRTRLLSERLRHRTAA
jgi:hypothetical protein